MFSVCHGYWEAIKIPRQLGDAFVTISPDSTGFRAKAQADIKKALAGINPTVPVDLKLTDNGKFITNAAKALRIQANLDARQAYAQIIELRKRLEELHRTLGAIPIGVDDHDAEATITRLQRRLLELAHSMAAVSTIDLHGDTSMLLSMHEAISSLEGATDRLARSAAKSVGAFRAQADAEEAIIRAAEQAAVALSMQKAATDRAADGAVRSAATSSLLGIAMGRLPPIITRGNNILRAFGVTGGILGGVFAFLGAKITLFGGILNKVLPAWATHISVGHILADVLVELIAVWGGAAIAAVAFGVAASDAVREVTLRMQNLHVAADATGLSMPPLTGALEKLHDVVRPAVFQVFGDALVVAKAHTGDFQKIVKDTTPVIEQLAGRMTAALTSGHAFDIFTKNAKSSLQGLGTSFGNVFGAIGNILNVVPDYAQKLLSFGVVVTGLIENFTRAIEPILRWGLAIHGAFIYLGLAATLAVVLYSKALVPLTLWFYRAAQAAAIYTAGLVATAIAEDGVVTASGLAAVALEALGDVPVLVWVALIGAGIAALILAFRSGSNAANDFNASIEKSIGQASVAQTLNALTAGIAATRVQLAKAQGDAKRYGDAIANAGNQTVNAGKAGSITSQQVMGLNESYQHAQQASQAYAGELVKLQGEQKTFNTHLAAIAKITGSTSSALGALTAAGVTQNQMLDQNAADWAATTAQVLGTLAGFQAMTGVAGQLNNDLDVLGRTETDNYKATQQLNQAWSSFISDLTSTQGSFDTLALGMVTLDQNFQQAGGSGETLKNTLGKLSVTTTLTGASIDGLNQASLDLNQAFTTQVSNADKLFASWRTAGLANSLFIRGIKDAIIPLVKYASGSKEATAQLVALAQEADYTGSGTIQDLTKWLGTAAVKSDQFTASVKKLLGPMVAQNKGAKDATKAMLDLARQAGYTGGTSMKQLVQWMNSTSSATKDLKAITDQATQQEALLSGAMQSQGKLIANQLIGDINQAILKYDGVQKAAAAYGDALAKSGGDAAKAKPQQDALILSITKAGLAAHSTTDEIATMIAKVLGIPKSKAIDIILQMSGQGKITISGPAVGTKTLSTSGSSFGGSAPGSTGGGGGPGVPAAAGGLYVPHGRGPLIDDYPALLAKGEVVVPTRLVNAGLVDHLRGRIPGFGVTAVRRDHRVNATRYNPYHFAAGGLAGAVGGQIDRGIAFMSNSEAVFGQAAAVAFAQAIIKQAQAVAASGFLGPGSGSYAADIQTVLRAMGLPLSLTGNWLSQIQTESGGNLRAVNLTDSNAAAGHPSVGLLQLIPSTFAAYAGPYRNTPPLVNYGGGPVSEDPMAQIYAAIHYAAARYGGAGMAGVIGHGHGYKFGGLVGSTYDKGGILPPWKIGVNTSGKAEMVSPATGAGSLHETNLLLRQLIHEMRQNTRVTGAQGQQFAHGIGVAASRGASRGFYGG